MKTAIISIVVIAIVGFGAWYIVSQNDGQVTSPPPPSENVNEPPPPSGNGNLVTPPPSVGPPPPTGATPPLPAAVNPPPPSGVTPPPASASETKTFTVAGSNFAFAPSAMTVKKGDTVKIIFKNSGGSHNLVIDEFPNARTSVIQSGAEETIEFVADKSGSFEYYCSVGSHRAMGMKGTLTVQ